MDGISIVVFLMRCTAGLTACQELPTDGMRYTDMETCIAEVSRVIEERRSPDGSDVWLARCRYLTATAATAEPIAARPAADAELIHTGGIAP